MAGIRAEYVSNIETLEFRSKEKVPCLHTQSLSKVIKRTITSVHTGGSTLQSIGHIFQSLSIYK